MKLFSLKALIALLSIMALVLVSCEEDNTVTPDPEKPEPVTNVQATSIDNQTIKIKWDLSPSESNTLFDQYMIEVTPGAFAPMYAAKNTDMYTITGLTEGEVYTITVKALYTNDEESTGASVMWSPSTRFTNSGTGNDILMYEYTSSFGSGLDLYYPDPDFPEYSGPMSWKTSDGEMWDLGLDTQNGELVIASARLIDWTSLPPVEDRKVVQIGDRIIDAQSLDEVFDSEALNVAYNFEERRIDLTQYNSSFVLICRVVEPGNTEFTYAKVLVEYKDGSFLQGSSPDRYVKCTVSYQMTPGIPYARTENVSVGTSNTK
jgi:hypothetical protein